MTRPPHDRRPAARRGGRTPGERRGAAFVEFAAIAPFFLILAIMSAEMGACIHTVHRLSAALREGGRLAAMDWDETLPGEQSPGHKIEEDVRNFLAASGIDRATVEFSMTHADGPSAGQPFVLGAPGNRLEIFTMEASVPTPEGYFARRWFSDRLTSRFAFRAGRDAHAP